MLVLFKQFFDRCRRPAQQDAGSEQPGTSEAEPHRQESGVDLSTTLLDPRYEALCLSGQAAQPAEPGGSAAR